VSDPQRLGFSCCFAVIDDPFFLLLLCWIFGEFFSFSINGLWAVLLLSNNSMKTASEQQRNSGKTPDSWN